MSVSRQWKFLIDPLTGNLVFVSIPILTVPAGGILTGGVMEVNPGSNMQFNQGLDIGNGGDLVVNNDGSLQVV